MADFFQKSFAYGSSYEAQPSDFDVAFSTVALPGAQAAGSAVTVLELQKALEKIVGTQRDHNLGVDRIGLLFAGELKNQSGVFGMMFDSPAADPNSAAAPYSTTPRQGCAVFLDAIAKVRLGEAFSREILYTAMHEMGHVFNLWHLENGASFMASSLPKKNAVRDDSYFRFIGEPGDEPILNQRKFLSKCSSAITVHPGGNEFGRRDPEGPNGVDPAGVSAIVNGVQLPQAIKLKISVHQQDFWAFEPVELDISVWPGHGRRSIKVSNVFDPGYDCFTLWIEDERGWRRKYRAPVRFCQNFETRDILHASPFRRDIPFFRQGGGLTFPYPGDYTVQLEMALSKKTPVRSNKLSFHVLAPDQKSKAYQQKHRLVGDLAIQSLLYYKHDRITRPQMDRLQQAVKAYGKCHIAGVLSHALAKSFSQKLNRSEGRISSREQDIVRSAIDKAGENLKRDSHSYSKILRGAKDWNDL